MKKQYNSPATTIVEVKIESLLVDYSNTQAAKGATTLSREGNSDWEDE